MMTKIKIHLPSSPYRFHQAYLQCLTVTKRVMLWPVLGQMGKLYWKDFGSFSWLN